MNIYIIPWLTIWYLLHIEFGHCHFNDKSGFYVTYNNDLYSYNDDFSVQSYIKLSLQLYHKTN